MNNKPIIPFANFEKDEKNNNDNITHMIVKLLQADVIKQGNKYYYIEENNKFLPLTDKEVEILKNFSQSQLLKNFDESIEKFYNENKYEKLISNFDLAVTFMTLSNEFKKKYTKTFLKEIKKIVENEENKANFSIRVIDYYLKMYHDYRNNNRKFHNEDALEFLLKNDCLSKSVFEKSKLIMFFSVNRALKFEDEKYIRKDYLMDVLAYKYYKGEEKLSEKEKIANIFLVFNEYKKEDMPLNIQKKFLRLLSKDILLKGYINHQISDKDISFFEFNNNDLLKLEADELIRLKDDKLIKLPKSEIFIDSYGTRFKTNELIELAENGCIEKEDIIKILKFKNIDEDYDPLKNIKLLIFYNAEMLDKLILEGKIDNRFIELFSKELLEKVNELDRNQYFENIKSDLKKLTDKKEEYIDKALKFNKLGLLSNETFKKIINKDDIEKLYFDEKINDNDIINLYKKGVIDKSFLTEYFNDEDLFKEYYDGNVGEEVLEFIDKDYLEYMISDKVENENYSNEKVLNCFKNGYINGKQLKNILAFSKRTRRYFIIYK